jgi:hypothetical protein
VEPLFKYYKNILHLLIKEDLEVVPGFERNNAGLRNCQALRERTSDSSAFLNAVTCPLKYVFRCEQHFFFFSFFDEN